MENKCKILFVILKPKFLLHDRFDVRTSNCFGDLRLILAPKCISFMDEDLTEIFN